MKITYTVPPTKKWLITKDRKSCSRCVESKSVDIVIDESKMSMHVTCQDCGYKNTYPLYGFQDKRPCKTCNFERVVKVKIFQSSEHWEENCDICRLVASALSHESQARVFRERARKMLAERQRKHPTQ